MSKINFEMPRSAPGLQSDYTKATGLRNFLKGEVITVNSDSDDDERINTTIPAMKCVNLPTQEKVCQIPEGVHPSRLKNHISKEDPDPTWREPKMRQVPTNRAPTGNNKIPLPVNALKPSRLPYSIMTSYGTGTNHNMLSPELRGPPKAPKAMISQSGNVKQPPIGPKVDTTPRKSGAAERNRSVGHSLGTPRRKKYIAARKLLSRKNDPNAVPVMNNGGSSYPPSTTQSAPPRVDTRKGIPVVKRIAPLGMRSLDHREEDTLLAKPLISELPFSKLKNSPGNAFHNLAPTVGYGPKHSAVRPQHALFHGSVTPELDTAPWDEYVQVPEVLSKVTGTTNVFLEQGHQVHPTRLNHFEPHYSTTTGSDRYLSPPTKVGMNNPTCKDGRIGPYKDGDIIGAGAGQIAATSKGRHILEKMGYKPGVSLGKSGKEETKPAVVTMKIGRGGLGAAPKEQAPEVRGVFAVPSDLSDRNLKWAGNTSLVGKRDEVQSRLESSDQEILGAKGRLEPSKIIVQDNGHGVGGSGGGGTKARVVITIDSDNDEDHEEEQEAEKEERVQELLPQEKQQRQQQGQQKDEKMKKDQDPVMDESEVEYDPEDMEMGDTHDYVQVEQASTRLHQNPGTKGDTCHKTEGQPMKEDAVDTSFKSDTTVLRWKLPPFRYSSSSCRPTVPMQLLGLVIIERLEQVALVEIFHCISAFEEDSYRLTDQAFNHVLAKSFLKVRGMFMRDPLLDVDQEICEGIVKEEFGALLEHLTTSIS